MKETHLIMSHNYILLSVVLRTNEVLLEVKISVNVDIQLYICVLYV